MRRTILVIICILALYGCNSHMAISEKCNVEGKELFKTENIECYEGAWSTGKFRTCECGIYERNNDTNTYNLKEIKRIYVEEN